LHITRAPFTREHGGEAKADQDASEARSVAQSGQRWRLGLTW
jgi:hypothetical protein